MHRITTLLLVCGVALLSFGATTTFAQQDITLDQLNRIPQADLDSLADLGADMTGAQYQFLILPQELLGDTVKFVVVIASDPFTSGRASWNSAENRPNRIHMFVVDTTANSQGSDGMWMQIVDGDFLNTGTLDLVVGDVVEIVGVVANFFQTVQITPLSYQVIGTMADFGISEAIMDPIIVTSEDMDIAVEGGLQGNLKMWSRIGNAYVKIESATVLSRTIDNSGRPDFDVSTDGGVTAVDMTDTSIRFRNDQGVYSDDYNKRDRRDPFVPPPPGSVVNLSGFAVSQGDDPQGRSVPRFSIINITPWEDSDLEILESPPQPSAIVGPTEIPGSDAVPISIDVVADPSRTIAGVVLNYSVAPSDTATGSVDMVNTAGTTWSADITGMDDGTIIRYWAVATDNTGASTKSNVGEYRALTSGITGISEIQFTFDGGPGDSPLAGFTTAMNIVGTVSTEPSVSGILGVQDDASNAPWSGIVVELDEAAVALGLTQGDSVRITAGSIKEIRGDLRFDRDGQLTGIQAATIEKIASAASKSAFSGYKDVDPAFLLSSVDQEAHESMMLNFSTVRVTDNQNGFGEWLFAFEGDTVDVVADDASNAIDNDDSDPLFENGEGLSFLRGFWSESFGTYRLIPEQMSDIGERTPSANEAIGLEIPDAYTLEQNYPNPFNPSTSINYGLKNTSHVKLQVFDVTGRLVETLVDEQLSAGSYRVSFDAGNLASGVYLYRMQAGPTVITNRMLLLK